MSVPNGTVTNQVSFGGVNPATDWVLTLDSAVYGPPGVGVPAITLVLSDGIFWQEPSPHGIMSLCTTKVSGKPMLMTFMKMGVGPVMNAGGHLFAAYQDNFGNTYFAPEN